MQSRQPIRVIKPNQQVRLATCLRACKLCDVRPPKYLSRQPHRRAHPLPADFPREAFYAPISCEKSVPHNYNHCVLTCGSKDRLRICSRGVRWSREMWVVRRHQFRKASPFDKPAHHVRVHLRNAPPLQREMKIKPHHSRSTHWKTLPRTPPQSCSYLYRQSQPFMQIRSENQLPLCRESFFCQFLRKGCEGLPFLRLHQQRKLGEVEVILRLDAAIAAIQQHPLAVLLPILDG